MSEWIRVVPGEKHLEALRRALIEQFDLSVRVCVCAHGGWRWGGEGG